MSKEAGEEEGMEVSDFKKSTGISLSLH